MTAVLAAEISTRGAETLPATSTVMVAVAATAVDWVAAPLEVVVRRMTEASRSKLSQSSSTHSGPPLTVVATMLPSALTECARNDEASSPTDTLALTSTDGDAKNTHTLDTTYRRE
jgi:hypothetical protein